MVSASEILKIAQKTLRIEADAVSGLIPLLKNDFAVIVGKILALKGRVIVTGVGKSAIIAQKIVATLNSTGTPSVYLHAGDAVHGDLGTIQKDDLVICISNSGNTPEIKVLLPLLRQFGTALVGIVGDLDSALGRQSDYVLNATVAEEACPHNLAPTSSTMAQMAIGDALAVCLLECRQFSSEDFARFHPGGSLGKRLYLKVGDLASNHERPEASPDTPVKQVLVEITRKRLGAVAITEHGRVTGIVTDGDIRRMLEKYEQINGLTARDIMGKTPRSIGRDELAVHALEIMRTNNITQLIVVEGEIYFGIVHLHDLLKEGII